jgi:hypothetical protein
MGYKYIYKDLSNLSNGFYTIAQPPHGKIWKIKEIFGLLSGTSNTNAEIQLRKFHMNSTSGMLIRDITTSSTQTFTLFYIGSYTASSLSSIIVITVYNDLILTEFDNFKIVVLSTPVSPSYIYILIEEVDA